MKNVLNKQDRTRLMDQFGPAMCTDFKCSKIFPSFQFSLDFCWNAGKTHTRKMTLSLWQKATIIRCYKDPEDRKKVIEEKMVLRRIFSGATNGSDRKYRIQDDMDVERVQVHTYRLASRFSSFFKRLFCSVLSSNQPDVAGMM